jgi:enamine deaminase RidA (YjgF/YER057c/UK114 family)
MSPRILLPAGWARPRGYAYGLVATGQHVFIAGQIGWDGDGRIVSDSFAVQTQQALANVVTVLKEAGGRPEHLVRLTWFITSRDEYEAEAAAVGAAYRSTIGRHFPTMSVVQVVALMESRAKVEIEATAIIPTRDM